MSKYFSESHGQICKYNFAKILVYIICSFQLYNSNALKRESLLSYPVICKLKIIFDFAKTIFKKYTPTAFSRLKFLS